MIKWTTGIIALIMAIIPYAQSTNPVMYYKTPSFAYDMIGGLLVITTIILWLKDIWDKN